MGRLEDQRRPPETFCPSQREQTVENRRKKKEKSGHILHHVLVFPRSARKHIETEKGCQRQHGLATETDHGTESPLLSGCPSLTP